MMVAIVATVAVAVGVVVAAAAATIAGKQNVRFVIVHGIGRSAALRRHGGKHPNLECLWNKINRERMDSRDRESGDCKYGDRNLIETETRLLKNWSN